MKKRLYRILNFFSFNLLFFALYLNFVQKDKSLLVTMKPTSSSKAHTVSNVTVPYEKKDLPAAGTSANLNVKQEMPGKLALN